MLKKFVTGVRMDGYLTAEAASVSTFVFGFTHWWHLF